MGFILKAVAASLFCCLALHAQTPATVAAELRGIEQDLNPYTVMEHQRELPAGWTVVTPDGTYYISAAPLRTLLGVTSKSDGRSSAIAPSKQWLDARATELENLTYPGQPHNNARGSLNAILSRKEFAPPGPQSIWQRIREQINQWVLQLIQRLFGQISKYPITGTVVFWGALAGAVGLLAYWLVTLLYDDAHELKLTSADQIATVRTSGQWIAALNAARDRGDLRTAVQCAYWAGVARLQDTGGLPAATAKTPREYLQASQPAVLRPLRSLTSSLERFWYGCAEATAGDLSACMQSLQELGCRLD